MIIFPVWSFSDLKGQGAIIAKYLHKWHWNLNNNTLENLSFVLMFPDRGFVPWCEAKVFYHKIMLFKFAIGQWVSPSKHHSWKNNDLIFNFVNVVSGWRHRGTSESPGGKDVLLDGMPFFTVITSLRNVPLLSTVPLLTDTSPIQALPKCGHFYGPSHNQTADC